MGAREFRAMGGFAAAALLAACLGASPAEGAPRFNVLRFAPEGAVPPKDFSFPGLDGRTGRLSDHRGKVVLLAFFATWCPLCNEEMPKLTRLQEKFGDRGFVVLAVSIDRAGPDLVRAWADQKKLTYPILHDRGFTSRRTHNVRFVPTLYLLDRGLGLRAWAVGAVDWEGERATALIEKLLDAPPPARSGG